MWDVGSFKRIKHFINKVHLESKASGTPANSLPPSEFLLGCACLPQPALPPIAMGFFVTKIQISRTPVSCIFSGHFVFLRIFFSEVFCVCVYMSVCV